MTASHLIRTAAAMSLLAGAAFAVAQAPKKVPVRIPAGDASTLLTGKIEVDQSVDYTLSVGAGQLLRVSMKATNGAMYFNILPPGSDVAMVNGQLVANKAARMTPVEGVYRIRVYLMRSSARRNEDSSYKLRVGVTGKALPALRTGSDKLVAGTQFHATAKAPCEIDLFPDVQNCNAGVIRRGKNGTGTVVFAYKGQKRRVLFVDGKAVASDAVEKVTSSLSSGMIMIKIGDIETYRIAPEFLSGD